MWSVSGAPPMGREVYCKRKMWKSKGTHHFLNISFLFQFFQVHNSYSTNIYRRGFLLISQTLRFLFLQLTKELFLTPSSKMNMVLLQTGILVVRKQILRYTLISLFLFSWVWYYATCSFYLTKFKDYFSHQHMKRSRYFFF